MHVKTLLVTAIVIGRIKFGQTTEDVQGVPADSASTSTENSLSSTQNLKNYEETSTEGRDSVKHSNGDLNWTERLKKPFLYGRKFEFAHEEHKERGSGELYSPIITSPILTLPFNTEDLRPVSQIEPEILKHNQNEIFTSIRDSIKETAGVFNKTYFTEEGNETEDHGGQATTENTRRETAEEANNPASRSREHGERSLLVVLPFKADEDNVEELFTKSPLVKVIETEEHDPGVKLGGKNSPPAIKKIIPTTSFPVTRKRWRPTTSQRLTTEPSTSETTTESGDIRETQTNYDDVEMVTKKYQPPTEEPEKFPNHKYEEKFTPYPAYKRIKINKEERTEIVQSANEKPKESKPKRKSQRRKSTTEGPPKPEEISKVLDILPSDVKDLILEIGLNKENKEQKGSEDKYRLEKASQPTIDPKSYAVFKPLPLGARDENKNFVSDDMKDFLFSFGLLPSSKRVQKSLKENTTQTDEKVTNEGLDFLPDDLKLLLEEMGLVKGERKKEPTRIHIFNPSNHSIAHNEEDREKLNAILSSIKTTVNESQSLTPEMQSEVITKIRDLNNLRYKDGNLTEINNEIQKIVVNKKSDKKPRMARRAMKLNEGPDPLMFDDESLLKNDVKRQDTTNSSASASASSSVSSGSGSSSSDDSTSASDGGGETTMEETPNIEALKESFGGGETASDDADIESSLPPRRPNGLYLLLDWNSFLEVGTEDDSRRVNLRFQPKIGDSRNFLPVSVP